ncbi:uncharacterized protein FIESC28_09672 [Fusarium coffeatum]|uniref:Peptide hydrolase n=1 Tax=Fusarium coffeatum TaxID=231269 RepID=A0A366R0S5_9HYPO|nr:uncharacterized protein FIESC28_09672 [Fusarium coffeatum]RBR09926.1 hypothetical protein FIESC28_09672 [Fusarium coffeatum]
MKFTTALAALSLLAPVFALAKEKKLDSVRLQADIKTDNLMSNLEALNDISFDNGGNRAFGSPGYDASVAYIYRRASEVKDAKVWKQYLSVKSISVDSIALKVDDKHIRIYGLTYSPSTSAQGITAEIVLGPEGAAGCDASSYRGLDVKDKIVLVQRSRCPNGDTLVGRVMPAAAAGAAAVIIYHDLSTDVTTGSLGASDTKKYVPAGLINSRDGLKLKERIKAGQKVEAHFQQTQNIKNRVTQNVIAETSGGDPRNVIMVGAHLDSVQAGPGINDNGSGSSLILELFIALSNYETKSKIRFAWWGAEEKGLLGSNFYTSNLAITDVNDLLVYLNFDMVAKGYFGVADTDGSSYGSKAPKGSEVTEKIFVEYFTSKGIAVTPVALTNGSDYASFWQNLNKPFGFLHTGTAVEQDPCYHQVCDTINNIDPRTLTINAKVSSLIQRNIMHGSEHRQAAAHMLAILDEWGSKLIPKTQATTTSVHSLQQRHVGHNLG